MEKLEKFTLINKDRSRIKFFELFEDVSKSSLSIDAMMISYGCLNKGSKYTSNESWQSRDHRKCETIM